jgi:hypothetical protein
MDVDGGGGLPSLRLNFLERLCMGEQYVSKGSVKCWRWNGAYADLGEIVAGERRALRLQENGGHVTVFA